MSKASARETVDVPRYLGLLGVEAGPPTLDRLRALVRAHLERVPFENVSKLYWLRTRGLRGVPALDDFLEGIERHHFGGTCYSANPYLCALLQALGYDVTLCGADMSQPDLHIALLVRVEGREYLVDVGYGAPFAEPVPRDLKEAYAVRLGNERFLVEPQDAQGRTRVVHQRDGVAVHGYTLKPQPRAHHDFRAIIEGSFAPDAHFMTCVRLVRFVEGGSVAISDLVLAEAQGERHTLARLADAAQLVDVVERRFGIPQAITREAIAGVAAVGAS